MHGVSFDERGRVKRPASFEVASAARLERRARAAANPNKIIIDFEQETEAGREDVWTIHWVAALPPGPMFDLRKWVNGAHHGKFGSLRVDETGPLRYTVVVRAGGNMCLWAHSYFNGLVTALLKDHGADAVLRTPCKHGHGWWKGG